MDRDRYGNYPLLKLLKEGPAAVGEEILHLEEVRDKQIHKNKYINRAHKTVNTNPTNIQNAHHISEHIEEDPVKAGYVPPPFKYLGPGNSLNRGKPYNQIDADAQLHDHQYSEANSQKDIYGSDLEFISRAGDHFAEGIAGKGSISDTLGSIAGGIGIGVKHLSEKVLGKVQYPSNLSDLPGPNSRIEAPTLNESTTTQKRTGGVPAEAPPAKQANTSTGVADLPVGSSLSQDVEMAQSLPGTGKEQADIGHDQSGMMIYEIQRPFSMFENRDNVYRKVHKFMTFGLAPNVITQNQGSTPTIQTNAFLTTYLAEIPWHIPALFMNQSEFDLLDVGAQCRSVSIEVYYRGTTIQFATASVSTNLATLNQINDIAVAHGLNKSGQGQNISYTSFDATQTMIPTGITKPKYDAVGASYRGMIADYYGTDNSAANFINFIPHHQVGRQTFLYNYWAQSALFASAGSSTNTRQFGGWPMLQDKVEQLDGKTAVNQCVLKAHFKPKMGMLKAPLFNLGHGLPVPNAVTPTVEVPTGAHLPNNRMANMTAANIPSASGAPVTGSETDNALSNGGGIVPGFTLYTPIEKSQFSRTGNWGAMDPHIQPSIHIGVQPVPALTTSSTLTSSTEDGAWTDVRAYWEVVCTMHTKEHDPTAYPFATIPNVPLGDVVYFNSTPQVPAINSDPRNDGATWQGLYTRQFPDLGADI